LGVLRLGLWSETRTLAFREQTWSAPRITVEELRVVTPAAQRDEPGVGRKRSEYPHGPLPIGRRPPASGRGGRLPSYRDPCSTHSLQRRNRWGSLSATASRHPAFMANESGQPARRPRLVSPHPKAGTSRGRYWRLATVRAWARRWAKERYGRKLSANRGDRHVPADAPTATSAQTSARADLEAIVVLGHRRDGGGSMGRSCEHTNVH